MTVATAPLATVAAQEACGGARFFFLSVRTYEADFRQFLIQALRERGHDVWHVRIGRVTTVTSDGTPPTAFTGVAGFLALTRFLRSRAHACDLAVFVDSTGPYVPARSLALRASLGPALWCYDIFDNMTYDYRGLMRMRTQAATRLLGGLSPVQLALSAETLRLFPRAIHLDNAAHVGRIERRQANCRDLLLLSSIDARLDVNFTRRVAELAVDRRLVLYGRIESPAEFDRLCREQRNIVYRGEFRYADIATILRPFGIALAPYAMNALTEYINPDKFYYFLNSGMEVISTDIAQARRMRDRVHIATSPEDVLAIAERLQRDPAFRKNTAGPVLGWDQRAGDLLDVIARTRPQRVRGRRRSGHPPP
ncbi:MAG TPA: hypothetical protein VII40_16295 [Xanthobacteraceae bacterium]